MRRLLVPVLGVSTVLALIVGPVVYAFYQEKQTRNFRVVRDGILYRSAQMTLPGLKRIVHDHGIRTVVSLRDADRPDTGKRSSRLKFRLPRYRGSGTVLMTLVNWRPRSACAAGQSSRGRTSRASTPSGE